MKNVYTADHEEPDCMRCDHVCGPCEFCGENCGAEHGWNGYKRTVVTTPVKNRNIFNEEDEEEYCGCDAQDYFQFTLRSDARCLVIGSSSNPEFNSPKQVEKEFPFWWSGKNGIDFEKLSLYYDVIDYRCSEDGAYWPSWDCDSIVVMNPDVVIERPILPQMDKISEQINNHAHFLARDCQGWENMCADFRGMDLSGIRLLDADLSQARFEGAVLNGAIIDNVNLSYAVLDGASITSANMQHVNCSDASFKNASMENTFIGSSKFFGASLENANMAYMDIIFTDFEKANMRGVDLKEADVSNSSFMGTELTGIKLSKEVEDMHVFDTENVHVFIMSGRKDSHCAAAAFYSPEDDEVKPCTAVINLHTEKDGDHTSPGKHIDSYVELRTCRDAFHEESLYDVACRFFPRKDPSKAWVDPKRGESRIYAVFNPENATDIEKTLLDAVMGMEKAIDPSLSMERIEDLAGMHSALKEAVMNKIKELDIKVKGVY